MTDTKPAPTTGSIMFRECTWRCYRTTTQHTTSDGRAWYCSRCGTRSDEC